MDGTSTYLFHLLPFRPNRCRPTPAIFVSPPPRSYTSFVSDNGVSRNHRSCCCCCCCRSTVAFSKSPARGCCAVDTAGVVVHALSIRWAFRCLCGTTVLDKAERRMRCRHDANPVICTSATKRHVGSPRGVDEDCPLRGARSSEKDGKRERVSEHERPIV